MSLVAGLLLISLPFIAITVVMAKTIGLAATIGVWAATAGAVGVITVGVWLIGGGVL